MIENGFVEEIDKKTGRILRILKYESGKATELPPETIAKIQKIHDEHAEWFNSLPEWRKQMLCPNYGHWKAMIKAYGVEVEE